MLAPCRCTWKTKPAKWLRTLGSHLQGVGKSCLVLRYVRGAFDPSSKVTIGAAFMSHSTRVASGDTVKFEIWCVVIHCPVLQLSARAVTVGWPSIANQG